MVYRGLYSFRQREYASLLFSQTKSFWKEGWRVQVAHLDNAAHALSSPSRCVFICQQILAMISFVVFEIVVKSKSSVFCAVLMKFHLLGINWHVLNQSKCRNCCLHIVNQKIAPQAITEKFFQILLPTFFWGRGGREGGGGEGGKAAFWACACKLSWTLFSPARIQPI